MNMIYLGFVLLFLQVVVYFYSVYKVRMFSIGMSVESTMGINIEDWEGSDKKKIPISIVGTFVYIASFFCILSMLGEDMSALEQWLASILMVMITLLVVSICIVLGMRVSKESTVRYAHKLTGVSLDVLSFIFDAYVLKEHKPKYLDKCIEDTDALRARIKEIYKSYSLKDIIKENTLDEIGYYFGEELPLYISMKVVVQSICSIRNMPKEYSSGIYNYLEDNLGFLSSVVEVLHSEKMVKALGSKEGSDELTRLTERMVEINIGLEAIISDKKQLLAEHVRRERREQALGVIPEIKSLKGLGG